MLRREAREILGLPVVYQRAELDAAFRHHARLLHPDHGGDPEDFSLVVEAHRILAEVRSDPVQVVVADDPSLLVRIARKLGRRSRRRPWLL